MNVVLVSDDRVLPQFLGRPLGPAGHRLHVVDSFAELKDWLPSGDASAVVLPRRLPDVELSEALGWLQAREASVSPAAANLLPTNMRCILVGMQRSARTSFFNCQIVVSLGSRSVNHSPARPQTRTET